MFIAYIKILDTWKKIKCLELQWTIQVGKTSQRPYYSDILQLPIKPEVVKKTTKTEEESVCIPTTTPYNEFQVIRFDLQTFKINKECIVYES